VRIPPPLDVHSHLATDINPREVRALGAYLFAMTRSLDEFDAATAREDGRAIWAPGVHPGLVRAHKRFDPASFERALLRSAVVGEVGLDATSRVPMSTQLATFRSILESLQRTPRIISVHSAGAQLELIRALHETPVDGVILHWWTGSAELTEEAVRLGCYFSLPPALMSSRELLAAIPSRRMLSETDHPYGDRRTRPPRRPGGVSEVELKLGALLGLTPTDARLLFWRNLRALTQAVGVTHLLGEDWRRVLTDLG
jgi:TatD DNase family protein